MTTGNLKTPSANVTPINKNKYRVNTGSKQRGLTHIKGITSGIPSEPEIHFTPKAWAQMEYIVDHCDKEVGWFTLQTYDPETNIFRIDAVVLPEQEVSSVETDISGEHWAEATHELILAGEDTSRMYGWFHSHVNMNVTPSPQDEHQVEEFLEDLVDVPEVPAFIRGIMNKQGDIKLDVYFMHEGIAYSCVPHYIETPEEWTDGLDNLIKTRVKNQLPILGNYPYTGAHYPSTPTTSLNGVGTKTPAPSAYNDDIYEDDPWTIDDAIYGVHWDESDPVSERPYGWYMDQDYQRNGMAYDAHAYDTPSAMEAYE